MTRLGTLRAVAVGPLRGFFCPPTSLRVPLGFYVPVVAGAVLWNVLAESAPPWALAALPLAGLLVWTLLEYVLHRVAFHVPLRGSLFAATRFLHGEHHVDPADPVHILTRPAFSFPMALLLWCLFRAALPSWSLAALPTAGVAVGYLWYEVVHYLIHRAPRLPLIRGLVRHHLHHHYQDQERCFGVSTRLWDVVFRSGRAQADSRTRRC